MKTTKADKKFRKPFFNFRGWLGWDNITAGGTIIKSLVRTLFVPQQATRIESFEDALIRLQLTENDVAIRIKSFRRLLIIFSLGTFGLFTYALIMLFTAHYIAALACFGLTAALLGQTFRYHFWLFQLKRRKLGCSLKEWLYHGLLGQEVTQQ